MFKGNGFGMHNSRISNIPQLPLLLPLAFEKRDFIFSILNVKKGNILRYIFFQYISIKAIVVFSGWAMGKIEKNLPQKI